LRPPPLSRYLTHSVRIGGASILAAAYFSDSYIMKAGRWKSVAFLNYIRLSIGAQCKALAALVNKAVFTNYSVTSLNSGR